MSNRSASSSVCEVAGFTAKDIERWRVQISAWLTLQHQKAAHAGPGVASCVYCAYLTGRGAKAEGGQRESGAAT